jgi:hypothetical protein
MNILMYEAVVYENQNTSMVSIGQTGIFILDGAIGITSLYKPL